MSMSLRDQLLKAGLVNEKQAKQATKQKQKQQRLEHKNQVDKDDSQRQAAEQAKAEKLIDAISARDYPVVQNGILLVATLVILVNFVVDILYGLANPRIRHQR